MGWEERWQEENTPWDAGASPPVLAEVVRRGDMPDGRVLVPGCGRGYDLLTIASAAEPATDQAPTRHVVGLDVAPTAKQAFEAAHPALHNVDYLVTDFFHYQPDHPFDAIWDYTFLCALDPSMRAGWADQTHALLRPGGTLFTLLFPVIDDPGSKTGPPWPLTAQLVRDLLGDRFEERALEPVTTSHPSRQGKEWLATWRRR